MSAVASPKPGRVQQGLRAERRSEAIAGYVLIAIPIVLFLVLNIGQIFYAAVHQPLGLGHCAARASSSASATTSTLLADPIFWKAIQNTLYYAILVVPLQMALGLFLAVIVNQKIRGQTFFRAAFYFPAIASSAAITVLFLFIFAPDGLFNGVREALGLNPLFEFFGLRAQPELVRRQPDGAQHGHPAQRLDHVRDDDAVLPVVPAVDRRTRSTRPRRSTAPAGGRRSGGSRSRCSPPAHFFVATVSVIGALQLFDQAIIAGGPGGEPNNALTTIVLFLYRSAIAEFDFGFAAAVGIVLFVIIFSVTLVQRRLFGQAPDVVRRPR